MLAYSVPLYFLYTTTFFKVASAEEPRFRDWFSRYEHAFNNLTQGNCSAEYRIYADNSIGNATIYPALEVWQVHDTVSPLLNCILDETPELFKSILTSSQVLLGLMPTILVNVGPDLHETAIVLTYGKRHILGFLVCLGSPSVLFNNTVGLRELVENLMSFKDSIPTRRLWGPNPYTIIIEYVLALAAIANIGEVFYEVGVKTASTITQKEQSLPAIWIGIGAVTHILGAVVLRIAQGRYPSGSFQIYDLREGLFRWLKRQFTPRVEIESIEFRLQPCSIPEMVVSWLIGIIATLNLIWGTMFFSSILFFPLEAALWTVLRIMLSAILCRIIVRYEICAIREQQPSQVDQNSDQFPMNTPVQSDRGS